MSEDVGVAVLVTGALVLLEVTDRLGMEMAGGLVFNTVVRLGVWYVGDRVGQRRAASVTRADAPSRTTG